MKGLCVSNNAESVACGFRWKNYSITKIIHDDEEMSIKVFATLYSDSTEIPQGLGYIRS